ncbi:hypothetical protein FBEOM_1647 [Fusarium beomiforme]|uniref:DUF6590 domain-containing protein n=1 Tax=Fusarium beomiforme TaxID=44412 RepID=A0A9P5ASR1_9HYPO|nr:hypothetical protein FBEOM_1647 [Fusarium beomiforme]
MYQTSRSGWSEWSGWTWNPDYQQYYRQRVDSAGNADIQWQSEYESAQNRQVPRTPVQQMDPMDQMNQQFGQVNIQSPEPAAGDEHDMGKEKRLFRKTSTRLMNKAMKAVITNEDHLHPRPLRKLNNLIMIRILANGTCIHSLLKTDSTAGDPAPAQSYPSGSTEEEDPVLQAAIAQSRHYSRDPYRDGEPSSAAYTPYTQEDEEEPGPAVASTNQEHIVGTGGESETLDPRYRVAQSHMFQPGEVFKVLWPEPAGGGSIVEETVYRDQYGGRIFVHFRRFIVVANDLGHCTCIPISTYGKKGCKKTGVKAEQHGIVAESSNRNPTGLSGEPKLGFPPVRVHIYEPNERISRESRVNYSKLTTVEHNVKVLFIGRVVTSDWDIVTDAVNTSWANKTHTHKRKHRR